MGNFDLMVSSVHYDDDLFKKVRSSARKIARCTMELGAQPICAQAVILCARSIRAISVNKGIMPSCVARLTCKIQVLDLVA